MLINGININITLNGTTICYDDLGAGTIPVIFIHGFPFDKSMWQPQVNFLKSSHRVIAYDIRGFGKSTTGTEKAGISLFADDLIGLMDALQISKAIVCGLSMGGYILLDAIIRYPGRFEAIILSDSQCIADSAETKEKRKSAIQQIEDEGLSKFAEGFVQNVFCKESLINRKDLVEKIKNVILSTTPSVVTATLRALAERDERCSSLHEISIPALILCGTEDSLTPLAQSEFMYSKIINSTFKRIEKAAHLANLEQADEFNGHMNKFISGL